MSNGYLVAAAADIGAAHAIGEGFGLDVLEADQIGDAETVAGALAGAANVGLLLSNAAAFDAPFLTLLNTLATRLPRAQLILVDADAREKFPFLPEAWPAMSYSDALARAEALNRQREPASEEPPRAHPLPPSEPAQQQEAPADVTPPTEVPELAAELDEKVATLETPPGSDNDANGTLANDVADIYLLDEDPGSLSIADYMFSPEDIRVRAMASADGVEILDESKAVLVIWSARTRNDETILRHAERARDQGKLLALLDDAEAPPGFEAVPSFKLPREERDTFAPLVTATRAVIRGERHENAPEIEKYAQGDGGVARSIDLDEFEAAPGAPPELSTEEGNFGGAAPSQSAEAPIPAAPPSIEPSEPPQEVAPAPPPAEPPAPPPQAAEAPTPAPAAPAPPADDWRPEVARKRSAPPAGAAPAPTAPADATAFAPKKLRRGTPELVRIVVHQPKDLQAVIKAAKKIDPRAEPAPQGMSIGEVALGASIGVALEVRGAACDGTVQRRRWTGDAIDFNFSAEADEGVKQVVFLARVFIDDAQIGVLAFTRNVSGPAKKPHSTGDRVRLKRHKRVFLSYSSKDRETVSQIATAYQSAGVEHFWDRTSLKSGEEWHPRLRREIDRADLFHLCWSRAAAESEWVKKEAEHALTRRRRHSGKPDITVQMLDGPPWAQHPPELDAINFDDFVRAAIVGYARGDGSA